MAKMEDIRKAIEEFYTAFQIVDEKAQIGVYTRMPHAEDRKDRDVVDLEVKADDIARAVIDAAPKCNDGSYEVEFSNNETGEKRVLKGYLKMESQEKVTEHGISIRVPEVVFVPEKVVDLNENGEPTKEENWNLRNQEGQVVTYPYFKFAGTPEETMAKYQAFQMMLEPPKETMLEKIVATIDKATSGKFMAHIREVVTGEKDSQLEAIRAQRAAEREAAKAERDAEKAQKKEDKHNARIQRKSEKEEAKAAKAEEKAEKKATKAAEKKAKKEEKTEKKAEEYITKKLKEAEETIRIADGVTSKPTPAQYIKYMQAEEIKARITRGLESGEKKSEIASAAKQLGTTTRHEGIRDMREESVICKLISSTQDALQVTAGVKNPDDIPKKDSPKRDELVNAGKHAYGFVERIAEVLTAPLAALELAKDKGKDNLEKLRDEAMTMPLSGEEKETLRDALKSIVVEKADVSHNEEGKTVAHMTLRLPEMSEDYADVVNRAFINGTPSSTFEIDVVDGVPQMDTLKNEHGQKLEKKELGPQIKDVIVAQIAEHYVERAGEHTSAIAQAVVDGKVQAEGIKLENGAAKVEVHLAKGERTPEAIAQKRDLIKAAVEHAADVSGVTADELVKSLGLKVELNNGATKHIETLSDFSRFKGADPVISIQYKEQNGAIEVSAATIKLSADTPELNFQMEDALVPIGGCDGLGMENETVAFETIFRATEEKGQIRNLGNAEVEHRAEPETAHRDTAVREEVAHAQTPTGVRIDMTTTQTNSSRSSDPIAR